MNNIFLFLYTYYELYFYFIAGCFGTIITCLLIRRKITSPIPIKKICIVLTGCFLTNLFCSIILKNHLCAQDASAYPFLFATFFKIFLSLLSGAILPLVFSLLIFFLNCLTNTAFFKKYSYGIIVFIYTIIHLILHLPQTLNSWCSVWYATDYSMGIGSRFFIGSVLRFFHRNYLEAETAYRFYIAVLILLIALTSYLLNEVIRCTNAAHKKSVLFIVLCFISGPGYISALWSEENMGRLETYTLFLTFLSVIFFIWIRNIYIRYGITTLFSCISIAIYQGNLFMYYTIILMLIIEDCLSSDSHAFAKRMLGLFNVFFTGISFVYFQFFSFTTFKNTEEMTASLRSRTNLHIEPSAINFELYQSVKTAFEKVTLPFLTEAMPRERTLMTLLLLLPIVILITAIYLKCCGSAKTAGKHILASPYLYYILLPLTILPQFILNTDWMRWMISIYIIIFFGILYLSYKNHIGMSQALDSLDTFIDNHMLLCSVVILYLAGLNKFSGRIFLPETDALISLLSNIIS